MNIPFACSAIISNFTFIDFLNGSDGVLIGVMSFIVEVFLLKKRVVIETKLYTGCAKHKLKMYVGFLSNAQSFDFGNYFVHTCRNDPSESVIDYLLGPAIA